jgi:hypothetical protein
VQRPLGRTVTASFRAPMRDIQLVNGATASTGIHQLSPTKTLVNGSTAVAEQMKVDHLSLVKPVMIITDLDDTLIGEGHERDQATLAFTRVWNRTGPLVRMRDPDRTGSLCHQTLVLQRRQGPKADQHNGMASCKRMPFSMLRGTATPIKLTGDCKTHGCTSRAASSLDSDEQPPYLHAVCRAERGSCRGACLSGRTAKTAAGCQHRWGPCLS